MAVTVGTPATAIDLVILQGASFRLVLNVEDDASPGVPADLTGFAGRGKVRQSHGGSLEATFTVTIPTPTNGQVLCDLTDVETASMSKTTSTTWVYDVEITDGVYTYRAAQGSVTVDPEATT